jgi:hypothetical protein
MNEHQKEQYQKAINKAKERGGECLSKKYSNNRTKMLWQCANGHEPWETTFKSVVNSNQWCKHCGITNRMDKQKNPQGLNLARKHAISKQGLCLSTEYKSNKTKMLWQCANSHEPWEASYEKVVSAGRWCPHCANEKKPFIRLLEDGLQQAQTHAALRGGLCLSTEYKGAQEKMLWQCAKGHKPWIAKFNNVLDLGNWCPECSKRNSSEQRTRLIFEEFFGKAFPTVKPTWNVNPWTYRKLELDGYCKEFNVAFEYDGQHHFGLVKYNGKKIETNELTYQKFKDHQKKKNCLKQGITLVNIPFISESQRNKFHPFLANVIMACKERGFDMLFTLDQLTNLEKKFYAV